MTNYPPGAEHDPRAPYNQKEPIMTKWEADRMFSCDLCDKEYVEVDENNICEECFISEEIGDDE